MVKAIRISITLTVINLPVLLFLFQLGFGTIKYCRIFLFTGGLDLSEWSAVHVSFSDQQCYGHQTWRGSSVAVRSRESCDYGRPRQSNVYTGRSVRHRHFGGQGIEVASPVALVCTEEPRIAVTSLVRSPHHYGHPSSVPNCIPQYKTMKSIFSPL